MKQKEQTIKCHYRDANNKILYFCQIRYRLGVYFCLEVPRKTVVDIKNNCFSCYDGENNIIILQNCLHKDTSYPFQDIYCFESLIKSASIKKLPEKTKFKTINFKFPYIDKFFYIVDYLETKDEDKSEVSLVYKENDIPSPRIKIDKNIKFELIKGYKCSPGSIGGNKGGFELMKFIKITAHKETDLDEFIKIIKILTKFFSLSLRQKLLITEIWSDEKENSLSAKLLIETFQYKILNLDYKKDIHPFRCLLNYAIINKNFAKIIKNFFKIQSKKYEGFRVFCDLYLRNIDAPDEIYPQIEF